MTSRAHRHLANLFTKIPTGIPDEKLFRFCIPNHFIYLFFVIAIVSLFDFTTDGLRKIKQIAVNLSRINKTCSDANNSAMTCHIIENSIHKSYSTM